MSWLGKLSAGPNPRKKRRKREYPQAVPPPLSLDGYQLIMQALHELDSPHEIPLSDIKRHIGAKLSLEGKELNKIAIELKAQNLGELAAKDTTEALKNIADTEISEPDEDESAAEQSAFAELVTGEAIPQPVFEVRGADTTATARVLDPLLSYMIKWHPEIILSSGRK